MNRTTVYYAVTSLFLLLLGSMQLYDMAIRYGQHQPTNWWGLMLGVGFIVSALRGFWTAQKSVTT